MTYGGDSLSPADVAILSGNNRTNGDDAFGGNWAWILVFLIFALGGFGNNGWGNRGNSGNGNGGSAVDGYVLATDFANLERKLDGVNNGICDSTFALNNTMTNGFASLQNTLCQGFSGINQNIVTNGYEVRNAIQGVSSQLANCCCSIEKGQMESNYLNAQNTCAITNAVQNSGRNTIDAINNVYNSLHNEIIANRIEDKNAQITAQQNEINALRLAASQERQNNYLISKLSPCPQPSYVVQPPTQVTFPTNCCGAFTGYNNCGC